MNTQHDETYHLIQGDCSGCQACVELCPEYFGWDEELERAYARFDTGSAEQVRQAAAHCPCDCIEMLGLGTCGSDQPG